jgi:hypothetical protein
MGEVEKSERSFSSKHRNKSTLEKFSSNKKVVTFNDKNKKDVD